MVEGLRLEPGWSAYIEGERERQGVRERERGTEIERERGREICIFVCIHVYI